MPDKQKPLSDDAIVLALAWFAGPKRSVTFHSEGERRLSSRAEAAMGELMAAGMVEMSFQRYSHLKGEEQRGRTMYSSAEGIMDRLRADPRASEFNALMLTSEAEEDPRFCWSLVERKEQVK